jgi:hypothetical protein
MTLNLSLVAQRKRSRRAWPRGNGAWVPKGTIYPRVPPFSWDCIPQRGSTTPFDSGFRFTQPALRTALTMTLESYRVLSHNLDVSFRKKIRIYLSDEDEIANGFAVPAGDYYTLIWINVNDAATDWTGRAKWLRKVITHELAHIFHFEAVRGTFWPFDLIIGNPLPGFWVEGLAQYQTEKWDALRGDQWLRIATYDDALDYRSGESAWDGRLMYATGNSQVRFFAEQYGDSTLAVLLSHKKPALFGIGRVHDFYTAFKDVTGDSYSSFEDRWRRHINIHYNTIAGQMERLDSLSSDPLSMPSRYVYEIQSDSSARYLAMVGLTSLERPIRRLWLLDTETDKHRILDDGPIGNHVSWHPDDKWIAYYRTTRGSHGSLLNELYRVHIEDGRKERLTRNRRASHPAWMPDGRLAFIGSEGGTANVFILDIDEGTEEQITYFSGDVQLAWLRRQPGESLLAFHRFDEDGYREIVILDPASGNWQAVGDPDADNRLPVWSPDGKSLAFTSLRDRVPNIFIIDPFGDEPEERVTQQFTGAEVKSWIPADSLHPSGRLIITTTDTKTRNYVYEIDAGNRTSETLPQINASYTSWTEQVPESEVSKDIPGRPGLIRSRKKYCSWCSINHIMTLPLPYFFSRDDWGASVITSFFEPLGKHLFVAAVGVSAHDPVREGFAWFHYTNRQLAPTLNLTLYHRSYSARFYGDELLIDRHTGADISAEWPLDWFNLNYSTASFGTLVSSNTVTPTRAVRNIPDGLDIPEKGRRNHLNFWFTLRQQRPYRFQNLHPLDGFGLRLKLTAGVPAFGGDTRFVRPDLRLYTVLQSVSNHRIYIYLRAIMQEGNSLNQDFFGLTRYGDFSQSIPGINYDILYGDGERVRGFSDYVIRNRLLFTNLEYRIPVISNLQTNILGFAAFGGVVLAPYLDAAIVWDGKFELDEAVKRAGSGMELKNLMSLGNVQMIHAVGFGQPVQDLFSDNYEIYYRLKVAIPF